MHGSQAHNVKAALVHCGALSSSMELLRQQEDATLCTDLSSMIYDLALSEPGLDIVCQVEREISLLTTCWSEST